VTDRQTDGRTDGQTGRQTDRHILQKWCVSASDIYLMVCTDVTCWSWFNVNQPTFHKDIRDKRFLNFHFQLLDLFDLKFGLPVTRVQGHICTKYEVSTVFLISNANTVQTVSQDGMQRIKIHVYWIIRTTENTVCLLGLLWVCHHTVWLCVMSVVCLFRCLATLIQSRISSPTKHWSPQLKQLSGSFRWWTPKVPVYVTLLSVYSSQVHETVSFDFYSLTQSITVCWPVKARRTEKHEEQVSSDHETKSASNTLQARFAVWLLNSEDDIVKW